MLFFVGPALWLLGLYVAAALLPAIVLLRYIYRHDTVEKEPPGLLLQLLGLGVVSALCAGVIEVLAQTVLDRLVDPASPAYVVILAFLVVALAEEGMKLFFLRRRTWREPAFNYRFTASFTRYSSLWASPRLKMSNMSCATACPWLCPGRCWRCRDTCLSRWSWACFTAGPDSARTGAMSGAAATPCGAVIWRQCPSTVFTMPAP